VDSSTKTRLESERTVFVMELELADVRADKARLSHSSYAKTLLGDVTDAPVRVSAESLQTLLQVLIGEREYEAQSGTVKIPERFSVVGRQKTREVIADYFLKLGLQVRTQCYGGSSRMQGCNVEGTLEGETTENPIVVGAHFDSVTSGAADDNGSGTAAMMEIARLLSSQRHKRSIRFVAFDQEELGLYGSTAYVKDVAQQVATTPSYAITLDMIGYDSDNDGAIHLVDCGRVESVPIAQLFLKQADALDAQLVNSKTCTSRTDHAPFWNKRIPAIAVTENFFGGDGNKCYHKTCDTISNMNFDYFKRIAETAANTVLALANP
jgi:hypothetical protein